MYFRCSIFRSDFFLLLRQFQSSLKALNFTCAPDLISDFFCEKKIITVCDSTYRYYLLGTITPI